MAPRQQVLAVPYARRAERAADAASLGGVAASSYATLAGLPDVALSGSFSDLLDVPLDLAQASGTTGSLARFDGANALVDSVVVETDERVGVGVPDPKTRLHVAGGVGLGMESAACDSTLSGVLRWTGSEVQVCDGTAWSALGASSGGGDPDPPAPTDSVTFNHTGGFQSFTVPSGVTSLSVALRGAEGGQGFFSSGLPGAGGLVSGVLPVTPGESLTIVVGGQGVSTPEDNGGGGGGGCSAILRGSAAVVVAGGGGGAGSGGNVSAGSAGGNGGGVGGGGDGGTMTTSCNVAPGNNGGTGTGTGGLGVSTSQAGSGGAGFGGFGRGAGNLAGSSGPAYGAGGTSPGQGGAGGFGGGGPGGDYSNSSWGSGGGGGGGHQGGGGGGASGSQQCGGAGGGGGSSLVSNLTSFTETPGANTGHGSVVLSW